MDPAALQAQLSATVESKSDAIAAHYNAENERERQAAEAAADCSFFFFFF